MLLLLGLPFAFLIFQSAFQHPGTLYRVYAFYPLAFVAGIDFTSKLQRSNGEVAKRVHWLKYFIIFCVVVMGFATIRFALLLDWHLASGTTFERAKQIVVHLKENLTPNERIAFSEYLAPSLVVFDDPPKWQMIGVEHETHDELESIPRLFGMKLRYLLVVQKTLAPPPLSYGPYELIDSQWNRIVPTVLGLPLAEYCPGYQFATYRLRE